MTAAGPGAASAFDIGFKLPGQIIGIKRVIFIAGGGGQLRRVIGNSDALRFTIRFNFDKRRRPAFGNLDFDLVAYRKVFEAWDSARGEAWRWFGTAELAYARFAFSGS